MNKTSLTLGLVSAILLLSMFLPIITKTANAQTSTISVYPTHKTVNAPSQLFTIDIIITHAPTLTQWIIANITWDSTILELETGTDVDIVEGPFLKSVPGSNTVFLSKIPELGRIPEATCAFLTFNTTSGDGILCTIKFRSKAVGTSDVSIDSAFLLNELDLVDIPLLQIGTVTVLGGSSPPAPVGGYSVPIAETDSTPFPWTLPLMPLVSVIILATAISVAYAKYSKKQQN